jgi:hypothetical protein
VQALVKGVVAEVETEATDKQFYGVGFSSPEGPSIKIIDESGFVQFTFTIPQPNGTFMGSDAGGLFVLMVLYLWTGAPQSEQMTLLLSAVTPAGWARTAIQAPSAGRNDCQLTGNTRM